jgi:hypothetical protein
LRLFVKEIEMNKFVELAKRLGLALKTYPAMSAALANVGVMLAGYLGLHITPAQLVYYIGVSMVLFGIIVHSNVKPLIKAEEAVTVLSATPIGAKAVEAVKTNVLVNTPAGREVSDVVVAELNKLAKK